MAGSVWLVQEEIEREKEKVRCGSTGIGKRNINLPDKNVTLAGSITCVQPASIIHHITVDLGSGNTTPRPEFVVTFALASRC